MTPFLGPLDGAGRVPARQQTRVSAFLSCGHGALARYFAFALPAQLNPNWQGEINTQLFRECEIVSLLFRATSWVVDLELMSLVPSWEAGWMISPASGIADRTQALLIDLAALAHALHGAIRPAALLPADANSQDPFVQALRRIEFESGRLIQAQIAFLKSPELVLLRDAISLAVEGRHTQLRKVWRDMLADLGVSEPESG